MKPKEKKTKSEGANLLTARVTQTEGARQKVTIVLMDGDEPGEVECSITFEPDVTEETRSAAVHAAMRMMEVITG
jgi:hypothetical protein